MLNLSRLTFLALGVSLGLFLLASASSPFDIEFPIPELGDCADRDSCKAYCNDLANKDACLEFARKHGLATETEVEHGKQLPDTGPGGCRGEEECRAYCEDVGHAEECIQFAEANGFLSAEDARRARESLQKTGPEGCRGANECRAYCDDPAHQEECLEYAHREGLISDKDAEVARRVVREGGPGGCRGEKECRSYCDDPSHLEECLNFAEREGFISKEEVLRVKKAGFAGGPGGCKGEEECHAFCERPENQLSCIDWAVQNQFMTEKEAELARKFAGKTGPGGCQGEACRDFCERPENSEVCLDFAEREGLIPPEELERAKKFLKASAEGGPGGCRGIQCRDYCGDSSHQDECFDFAKKQGLIRPEDEQRFETGRKIQQKLQESGGPGGCRNDDECRSYCTDPGHVEECIAFGAAHGGLPEEEVRKMLKEFTEGRFEAHGDFGPPEDFRRFEEESRKRFEEFRQLEDHFRGGEFPEGIPHGFPPQGEFPGGPPGGAGFVGPGGCTSPAECIKYCTEHKEDCFSFGPPGRPDVRPPEGGIPPGHEFPRIRQNIIFERPSDVPQDEFGRCVAEAEQTIDRGLLASDPEAFTRQKEEAIRSCKERLGGQFEQFRPPGEHREGEGIPPEGGGPHPCPAMPTLDQCPPGERKEVRFSSPECGTYYYCVPEGTTGTPPPPSQDQARICAEKGGVWDGSTCQYPTGTQPAPPPAYDPASYCVQQGGTWDGTTCRYPSTSPPPSGTYEQYPHSRAPSVFELMGTLVGPFFQLFR